MKWGGVEIHTERLKAANNGPTIEHRMAQLEASSGGGGSYGAHARLKQGFWYNNQQHSMFSFSNSAQTQYVSANTLRLAPYTPVNTYSIYQMDITVGIAVAGSTFRVLIYSDNDGVPYQKLYQSTNIDSSTTGTKNILTNFTFTGGTIYWMAIHASTGGNIGFGGVNGSQMVQIYQNGGTVYTSLTNPDYLYANGSPNTITPDPYRFSGSLGFVQINFWKNII